jgi:hypothetical protein
VSRPILIVGLDAKATAHEANLIADQWAKRYPDIELRLIAGATSMVLIPGAEDDSIRRALQGAGERPARLADGVRWSTATEGETA